MLWNELGVSGGTALIVLCALYFVIKWAVALCETADEAASIFLPRTYAKR